MDIEKIFKFLSENAAGFFDVSVRTLTRPTSYFELVPATTNAGPVLIERPWLNPKLFAFAAISIIFGTLINSLFPDRRPGPDLLYTSVLLLIFWFVYSTVLHWICRALNGKGSYVDTLSISIQVLATLFVLASLIGLIFIVVIKQWTAKAVLIGELSIGVLLRNEPELIFFVIQAILLAAYLPLALRDVHGLSRRGQLLVGLVPILTMWVGIWMYRATGVIVGVRG